MVEGSVLESAPKGRLLHPAALLLTVLGLLALALIAGPVLRQQGTELWPEWRRWQAAADSPDPARWLSADAVQDAAAWQRRPGTVFTTPQSQCSINADGDVLVQPPDTKLPFLFNLSAEALPSKEQACGHCPKGDPCAGPRLPHLCCGVCQFDGRLCSKLYPGESRSEDAAAEFMAAGHDLQDFSPCELFQRIRGRTLWFMGDSQSWQFYYALECFLREFAPTLQRSDPVPPKQMDVLATASQGYCHTWWPVPPECLELVHGTRVCVVRADTAGDMLKAALPTLQEHVPGFEKDIMLLNTGLHYFEFDGVCSNVTGTCEVPGPNSKYVRELRQLAEYREAHKGRLPRMVWMDTPPQHFPRTGYYAGDFHAEDCEPWEAWKRGDPVARAGGMWNVAASPFVPRLGDAHMRTWDASIPFWATHMPKECTHWCQPSAYHAWLYLLNGVLRDSSIGGRTRVAVHDEAAGAQPTAGLKPRQAPPP